MMQLDVFLNQAVAEGHADDDCISVISNLSDAAKTITHLIRRNGISADLGDELDDTNSGGDTQKTLDVMAEEIIIKSLTGSAATHILSEEKKEAVPLNPEGSLIVAVDPLDGSSNINVNVAIGTIFSILPKGEFLQKGRAQRAAGFFAYGPQTTFLLGFADGGGVARFVLDEESGHFTAMETNTRIPEKTREFAINAAYARHWFKPVKAWMDEIQSGESPEGQGWKQRWIGSLVADAWRIFCRGGIFLYPGDDRPEYREGRLRLVYEANPIALLVEKAGGRASDGMTAILDLEPETLHQHVPFIFGSREEVEKLEEMHRRLS